MNGTQLAVAHTVPAGLPLPVSIGPPAVRVLTNGIAAPLYFVAPERINVQIPWKTEPGPAEVVVQRGLSKSTEMAVTVADGSVNLFLHDGSSVPIAESVDDLGTDSSVSLSLGCPGSAPSAAGVEAAAPALSNGAPREAHTSYTLVPTRSLRVGGIPDPTVDVSTDLVGVYKMTVTVPQ